MRTTIGREKTTSSSFSTTIAEEAGATIKGIMEVKMSVSTTFETASSETFREETVYEDTITVEKGGSVIVWQYVLKGKYADTPINFRSDVFYHTSDPNEIPK